MQGETGSRILVVHEALPRPDRNACDLRLMQVLNELSAQGHDLTYIGRLEPEPDRYAQPLEEKGIRVYSQDLERLRRFGTEAFPAWSFERVLRKGRFDLAMLFHWFWNPLTVAEDYLDEIRRFSPRTRVAVLTDELHGLRERRLGEQSGLWADIERARSFEQREFEAYRNADMVLAVSESLRQGLLAIEPGLKIEILPNVAETASGTPEHGCRADLQVLAAQVRRVIERVWELRPKSYNPGHAWSVLRVEKEFPDLLTRPAPERIPFRLQAYCTLAECLLAQGNAAAALEQLRHIFTFVREGRPHDPFFARVLLELDECYRRLGTPELGSGLVSEARDCLAPPAAPPPPPAADPGADTLAVPPSRKRSKRQVPRLDISVIIPTYNRAALLASCLAALERQSLAKDRFEAVVVDDGSSDETERLFQGLSVSYPVVYRRQPNAGAGAARRLGSQAATGKYLLFFNDDTIAAPGLLEEHLRVQREYAQDPCAVLGYFLYRRETNKRALSCFLATRPLIFPYLALKPGFHDSSVLFITCNLSIRREAVLGAGSFDPRFRVAGDTELGVRLERKGYRILYHPQALAWHDHIIFTAADLIGRARAYAAADLLLFRKHPYLLASGRGPFGRLDADWAAKTRNSLEQSRRQIMEWTQAIARFDHLDFAPLFSLRNGEVSEAEGVLRAFDQIVPKVYWFHLFERLLELREQAVSFQPSAISGRPSAALAAR